MQTPPSLTPVMYMKPALKAGLSPSTSDPSILLSEVPKHPAPLAPKLTSRQGWEDECRTKKEPEGKAVGLRAVEGKLPTDANVVYPGIHTGLQWGKEGRSLLMERSSVLFCRGLSMGMPADSHFWWVTLSMTGWCYSC